MRFFAVISVAAALTEIPVEDSTKLSVKKFKARYVRKMRPVVIREPRNFPNWTLTDFKVHCGAGKMTRYDISPIPTTQWAGFMDGFPMTLGHMVEDLAKTNTEYHYGMGFDLKCLCPAFAERLTTLPHFAEDRMIHNEFHKGTWPELLVGLKDSKTDLRGDKAMLPTWLKVVDGSVRTRIIPLDEWRGKLDGEGGYVEGDPFPVLREHVNVYDDALVEEEFVKKRNVTVYTADLEPGDWLYVPVGALHGEKHTHEQYPTLAVTASYWDRAHRRQILDSFCDPMIKVKGGGGLRARAMGSAGFGVVEEESRSTSGEICLDVAGVTGDSADYQRAPASASLNDIAYNAKPVCASFQRGSDMCPAADSRCPDRPPPDRGAVLEAGALDLQGDGDVSRQELAHFLAQAAAYYHTLPEDASYDALRDWVQGELKIIWPPGGPQMTSFAIDRALKSRLSAWQWAKDGL